MEFIFIALLIISSDFFKTTPPEVINVCKESYSCKTAEPETKECLKEAINFYVENCGV